MATIQSAIELTADDDEFVFPTRLNREGPVDRHALTSAMRRLGLTLNGASPGVESWKADIPSPHDLRRTLNTRLAELKVPKEIRDRVLNHTSAQHDPESKHYNLHEYQTEKRDALSLWAETLGDILQSGAAVIPLKRAS